MNRRQSILVLGALAGVVALSGHTPYRQWMLYRQTHLLIFTSRDDPGSDELGERIAARLRVVLPDSKARVARAADVLRIASLITTKQADVAVLSYANAAALFAHRDGFRDFAPIALRVLVETPQYQVVCREDFKFEHAYRVAEALVDDAGLPPFTVPLPKAMIAGEVPTHRGAVAFARGEPLAKP